MKLDSRTVQVERASGASNSHNIVAIEMSGDDERMIIQQTTENNTINNNTMNNMNNMNNFKNMENTVNTDDQYITSQFSTNINSPTTVEQRK